MGGLADPRAFEPLRSAPERTSERHANAERPANRSRDRPARSMVLRLGPLGAEPDEQCSQNGWIDHVRIPFL
jgi:hypothetical protein